MEEVKEYIEVSEPIKIHQATPFEVFAKVHPVDKPVKFESLNTDIVKFSDYWNQWIGMDYGTTFIRCSLVENPEIFADIRVTII